MDSKKIVIYGQKEECQAATLLLKENSFFAKYSLEFADKRETLQELLHSQKISLVTVLASGAAGMEGVYAVRDYDNELPVFWFSDDVEFAMQSHRLECSYFARKPLTKEKLLGALQHCRRIRIPL